VSLRDGRFGEPASGAFAKINASVDFDRRLYREDIRGSVAYAKALRRGGFLSAAQERAIVEGLRSIEREIEGGAFLFREEDEDIHMNIERRLFETIGEAAGRLHTGRSRNEQIVLDERLYLAGVLDSLEGKMKGLLNALASKARATIRVIVPSYTHMMPAQAVSLAHIFLAYYHALARDSERMGDYRKRLMIMPLGSGAVAGSSIGIDREPLKEELGFESLSRNSVDAVSTRDFIAEFLFICASIFVTLSRMAEDMIINASEERGFFTIPDSLSTTSSLMPQKKNPDSLELIRGKSARVIGNLMSSLVMMKALPYSYNRDLQEDKEGLFDTVDAALACVQVMTEIVDGLEVTEAGSRRSSRAPGGSSSPPTSPITLWGRGSPSGTRTAPSAPSCGPRSKKADRWIASPSRISGSARPNSARTSSACSTTGNRSTGTTSRGEPPSEGSKRSSRGSKGSSRAVFENPGPALPGGRLGKTFDIRR